MYLFDTFDGFDERDIQKDKEMKLSDYQSAYFNQTDERCVMAKMAYPEKVHIVKGYFPETTALVNPNNHYLFVNLDFDLYEPTLAGVQYFFPRMIEGGVILVHDYFHMNYKGVSKAVLDYNEFILNRYGGGGVKLPIGDHISIALVKS